MKDEVLTLSTTYEVDYELVMIQLLWDHVGWQIIQFNVKLTHNKIFSYFWIRVFPNFLMRKTLNILTLIWNEKMFFQRIRNSNFCLYYFCSITWYSKGYKILLKGQPDSQTPLDHLIPSFSIIPLNLFFSIVFLLLLKWWILQASGVMPFFLSFFRLQKRFHQWK